MTDSTIYHLLAELTTALEADGYDMGTGKQLQVQELLRRLPEDTPPERLASLLCPLFARNRQEQEQFYELFRQCLTRTKDLIAAAAAPSVTAVYKYEARVWRNLLLVMTGLFSILGGYLLDVEVFQPWRNPTIGLVLVSILTAGYFIRRTVASKRKRRIWLAAQLLAIVAGVGLKQVVRFEPPPLPPPDYREYALQPGDTLVQYVRKFEGDSLLLAVLLPGDSVTVDTVFGTFAVESSGRFTYIAKDSLDFARDTVPVESIFASARRDTTFFIIVLQPGAGEDAADALAGMDLVKGTGEPGPAAKILPYPRDINKLLPDKGRQFIIGLYRKYAWVAKTAMVILAAVGLWALLQWRERRRRYLSAAIEERTKPPYNWTFRIENPGDIVPGDSAPQLLNLLRRRTREDMFALDIPATIHATVQKMGMATFKYRQLTSPPDYLLLIDRQSPNDHRAMLFDWMFRHFRRQEAPLERYFFEGDLRLCFNEKHAGGIPLRELQHRYGNSRLLVFSHGRQLLSPLSGRLERWTTLLGDWRRRALLSPMPLRSWGRNEDRLCELFAVLPATMEGWGAAVEQLDALDPRNTSEMIAGMEDLPLDPIRLEGDLIPSLQQHFSQPVLDWIAACAVYPLLQWELTLALGQELSSQEAPLLHFDNAFQLTRLPWFVAGRIPEAARSELIDYLAERGLEERVRHTIHELLGQGAQPDPASVAYEEYRANAALNELAFTQSARKRAELQNELEGLQAAGHTMDAVAFRYMKKPPGRADFVIPQMLKRLAAPVNHLSPAWKDWLWALPLWFLFSMFVLAYSPSFNVCPGNSEFSTYQEVDMCISTPREMLWYKEMFLADYVAAGDTASANKMLAECTKLVAGLSAEDSLSFFKNAAVLYFNKGTVEYLVWEIDSSYEFSPETYWPDGLCYWFHKAHEIDLSAGGIADADMLWAADRCLPLSGQAINDLPLPEDEAKPIQLRGRVLDANRGAAVSGVTVSAAAFQSQSDRNGYYNLTLPATAGGKTLSIRFEKRDYETAQQSYLITPGEALPDKRLTPVVTDPNRLQTFASKGLYGLRDAKGRVVIEALYSLIEYDAGGDWYRVQQQSRAGLRFGYVDAQGKIVIPPNYRSLGFLRDGLVRAEADLWGYLDRQGREVIAPQFERAGDFANGRAQVSLVVNKKRETFNIDKTGKCIANCPVVSPGVTERQPTRLPFSGETVLYFDENIPAAAGAAYSDLLRQYYAKRQEYAMPRQQVQQNNIGTATFDISNFFDQELNGNAASFEERLREVLGVLQKDLQAGEQIILTIKGFTDDTEAKTPGLAVRRAESVRDWVLGYANGAFGIHQKTGKFVIRTEAGGDQGIRGKEPPGGEWLRLARQRRATAVFSVLNPKLTY